MTKGRREIIVGGLGLAALTGLGLAVPRAAQAQATFPERPIRVVVPYAPGGGTDVFARRMATLLGRNLGQETFVENIGGAGGNLGMRAAADGKPDGHTLVFALTSQFAVNPSLFAKLPYDPVKDFKPVSLVGAAPYVLVVHPSIEVRDVAGLIDYARRNPGRISYASAGVGSGAHLASELLNVMAGIDMVHVPYRGAGEAYPDLLTGRTQVMFSTYAPIEGHLKGGRLRALAVSVEKRSLALPDLPTVGETLSGYEAATWYALAAPAGTPDAVVTKIHQALVEALKNVELRQQLSADAIEIRSDPPEVLARLIPVEIKKWAEVVKAAKIEVQ